MPADRYVVVSIVKGRLVRVHDRPGLSTAGQARGLAREIKLSILAGRPLAWDDVQVVARKVIDESPPE